MNDRIINGRRCTFEKWWQDVGYPGVRPWDELELTDARGTVFDVPFGVLFEMYGERAPIKAATLEVVIPEDADPNWRERTQDAIHDHDPEGIKMVAEKPTGVRSVVWSGSPRDYWNNMESIHHQIVAELFGETKAETTRIGDVTEAETD